MSRSRARSRIGKVDDEGALGVRWLTTGDVAKRLGVAMRTVSKWIDEGRLVGIRLPGSRERRVHPSAMEAFEREWGFDRARGKR
jgi:excisionase family DNA binding protein